MKDATLVVAERTCPCSFNSDRLTLTPAGSAPERDGQVVRAVFTSCVAVHTVRAGLRILLPGRRYTTQCDHFAIPST
jgi:hypothetical protein